MILNAIDSGTQVNKARSLMQKVWDTGKPWESLVSGEFFG
jgi:hypothetical protein